MLLTFTKAEMLKLWRTAAGLEPLRADCAVERVEGVDADAMIEPRMRAWYLNLLDTAPPALVPVEDVGRSMMIKKDEDGATAVAQLPERARRLLEMRMTGWSRSARPCPAAEGARRRALALNPYCAPGAARPLCAVEGRRVYLAPVGKGDIADYATAVVDHGADVYILDELLLATIPDVFNPQNDV